MIYWDLDGVIRDLHKGLIGIDGYSCPHYDMVYNGKTINQMISDNLEVLETSPPTIFYDLINCLDDVTILTSQRPEWRPRTIAWIQKHIKAKSRVMMFVDYPMQKMSYLKHGDILVDDYPFFTKFEQIAMVRYPYNKGVGDDEVAYNIYNDGDMFNFIQEHREKPKVKYYLP